MDEYGQAEARGPTEEDLQAARRLQDDLLSPDVRRRRHALAFVGSRFTPVQVFSQADELIEAWLAAPGQVPRECLAAALCGLGLPGGWAVLRALMVRFPPRGEWAVLRDLLSEITQALCGEEREQLASWDRLWRRDPPWASDRELAARGKSQATEQPQNDRHSAVPGAAPPEQCEAYSWMAPVGEERTEPCC